ncbi:hypothetical protein SDC9_96141 [bioreactor metagenome]|uniref:Uncharacterized protein n=1 Tax=bioreactor metagenome TaxID=1076179 RepID=A0A645A8G4_9ZZZZ
MLIAIIGDSTTLLPIFKSAEEFTLILTKSDFESVIQAKGASWTALTFESTSLVALAVAISTIHKSTPIEVTLINANFCSSGESVIPAILALAGIFLIFKIFPLFTSFSSISLKNVSSD